LGHGEELLLQVIGYGDLKGWANQKTKKERKRKKRRNPTVGAVFNSIGAGDFKVFILGL
jgi:hypothetical protein